MSDKPEPPRCAVALAVALPQELPSAASLGVPFAYTGVGKVQAAIAVADLIHLHRPHLVLNFGSVGRVRPGPYGLLEVARVLQRDMLAEPLAPRGSTPFHDGPHALESGWPGVVCATGDLPFSSPEISKVFSNTISPHRPRTPESFFRALVSAWVSDPNLVLMA